MDDIDDVPKVLAVAYAAIGGAVGLGLLLALLVHSAG